MLHRPVLGLDVLEIRQPLEVAAQLRRREPVLECRPAQPLRLLRLARRIERLDVGLFPRAVAATAIPRKMQVLVIPCRDSALRLRPCCLQRGKRLGRPAGSEKPAADLSTCMRPAPLRHGHQRDVSIDIGLAVSDVLQGPARGIRAPVPSARLRSIRQYLRQPAPQVCRPRVTEGWEHDRYQAVVDAILVGQQHGEHPVRKAQRIGLGPDRNRSEVLTD